MTGLGITVGIGATEEVAEADFSISGWTIMLTSADAVERALQKKCSVWMSMLTGWMMFARYKDNVRWPRRDGMG